MIFAINGARGRMGRMLNEVLSDPSVASMHQVGGLVERTGHPDAGGIIRIGAADLVVVDDPEALPRDIDVGLDFSAAGSGLAFARAMARRHAALLVGVTGLPAEDLVALREIAKKIPVLVAANTALGVLCLSELAATARRMLGNNYDVEVFEMHHRHKKDAPSGTAFTLARRLESTGLHAEAERKGQRQDGEIGISAARGGEVVGVHTIYFLGPNDQLELTHRANSRKAFAEGAVKMAALLRAKAPGYYEINDLLR